jgi:hypothetical protein
LSSPLFGQTFELPANYAFATKEDYVTYEKPFIQVVEWLENTPLNQEKAKRQQVNSFIFKYLEGSPTVNIELKSFVSELSKKNPDLQVAFMGNWAKHKLQNPALTDIVKLNTAGVKTALKIYQLSGASKDKTMEKIAKFTSEQELEEWVKSKIS